MLVCLVVCAVCFFGLQWQRVGWVVLGSARCLVWSESAQIGFLGFACNTSLKGVRIFCIFSLCVHSQSTTVRVLQYFSFCVHSQSSRVCAYQINTDYRNAFFHKRQIFSCFTHIYSITIVFFRKVFVTPIIIIYNNK